MVTDLEREGTPFSSFRVDRVTREDGRYLLYYEWPDAAAAEPRTDDRPTAPGEPPREPSTLEDGGATDV